MKQKCLPVVLSLELENGCGPSCDRPWVSDGECDHEGVVGLVRGGGGERAQVRL